MAKFSPTAHVPRYLTEFKCIGPDCPETCCSGWKVTIDKATFKQMKAIAIQPLKAQVEANLLRQEGPPSAAAWGSLRMAENGDCGFLDTDKLCSIQKTLGAQALSDTCNHYPRQYQQVDGEHRVYATLSCPEAARLALRSPEAMQPVQITLNAFANAGELPPGPRWGSNGSDTTEPPKVSHLAGRVLLDLWVSLFDQPDYSAFDALTLGLMLVRRVNAYVQTLVDHPERKDNRDQVLADLTAQFERFLDPAHNAEVLQQLHAITIDRAFEPNLLREVTQMVWKRRLTGSARAMLNDVVQGLKLDAGDGEASLALYSHAKQMLWPAWEAEHGHVLKNYLVNSLQYHLSGRHFGNTQQLEDDYLDLVIRAALLRHWLIGQLALHGEAFRETFTEAQVVRTFYALSRSIEHDNKFMPGVLKAMGEQGIRSLATGVVLLR